MHSLMMMQRKVKEVFWVLHDTIPWNYHSHFNSFTSPRKNRSVTLKDHRFNRLFVCCEGLTHHLDDIAGYLDKYRNIVSGITILDRSFVEMPILKPIFCAVALIVIHITNAFQALVIDCDTNFSNCVKPLNRCSILLQKICLSPVYLMTMFARLSKNVQCNTKKRLLN